MRAPDYENLIDAATWAFIRRTEAAYPPDTASLTIPEQRAIYDTMCRAFHQGVPKEIAVEDRLIAGVPCRIYNGALPSIVYFHGGGFVVGGLHSHDDICAELCQRTGRSVTAVDYRLAPEHLHPAAFHDALAVARAVATAGPIILVGDSAGGNLAAAVAQASIANPEMTIKGQVLIYPGLGGDTTRGSYVTHAHAPMLTRDDVLFYNQIRSGTPGPHHDATLAPLHAATFKNLPSTLAIAAACDPLADDAAAYAQVVTAAGGRAVAVTEAGLVHGYLRARTTVHRAARSFSRIVSAIQDMAVDRWPLKDIA
jgi:acetyl esterase